MKLQVSRRLAHGLQASAYGGGAFVAALLALAVAHSQGVPAAVVAVALGGSLFGLLVNRRMEKQDRTLRALQAALERLSAGDLGTRLEGLDLASIAPMAAAFNRVVEVLGGTRDRARELTERLAQLPVQLAEALEAAQRSADEQEAAVEETASLQVNINTSIRNIAQEVESLARANEESASSILQLGSAVEQVARAAAALQETVESSTSSLHQVGESIRTVAGSTDSVQSVAEETAASVTEMDRSLQEVGEHVRSASDLTERVSESAEEGSRAVQATIEGIAEIRDVTLGAKGALEGLASSIGEIGEIANVISAITDETNLLSLNAAIIAAQAGEHGKAFAVVAEQVKTLARRTSQSTREIEELIRSIQKQSRHSVETMAAGIASVERGVERSRVAGQALDVIRGSARDASGRVAEIARAADEQARNSKQVAQAARRTSEHVQEISRAMAEQSKAAEQLLANASLSVDMCRQMTSATEEQRSSGRYITSNIESITEMIRSIQGSTRAHERASSGVAETFAALLDNARRGAANLPALTTLVEELRRCGQELSAEIARLGADAGDAQASEAPIATQAAAR